MLMFWIIILMIILILIGLPVAYAIGLASLIYILIGGYDLSMVAQNMVSGVDSFTLLAVPFFLFLGSIMNNGGITDRIIDFAKTIVGHFKGGLAQVNIFSSTIFSGLSGSATADTVALGSVLIPAMEKEGYDKKFAAAITATSSIVGPIIPPSITMIIFGVITGTSIGPLLIAGIIPGILLSLSLMIYTYIVAKKRNYPSYEKATMKQRGIALYRSSFAMLLPIIIVVGIVSGIFTATEAAAVALLYAVIITLFVYKSSSISDLWKITKESTFESAKVLIIISCASVFAWVITRARVSDILGDALFNITTNKILIILLIIVFLLVIGLFMLPSEGIVVFAPILTPIMADIGMDPVQFGVLMVLTLTIGGASPPVGILLYIVADIAKLKYVDLLKEVTPMYIPLVITSLLVAFIPTVSLLLVKLLY
ncbi:TRAP transporter large permease [Nosocomiicoccus ampullae]|uniref:TRAP transporter large permease n=1 Tax=Nosocomiicoccus ampullae TaxID=489910 RepID=UPI001C5F48E1|nr:TRAP transporter large permease [Nosocomiicoccus ampullae]QYA49105.1 TRAP transporter large permease [Nosocomiicoccus ampullae]